VFFSSSVSVTSLPKTEVNFAWASLEIFSVFNSHASSHMIRLLQTIFLTETNTQRVLSGKRKRGVAGDVSTGRVFKSHPVRYQQISGVH
jgi:hypothetical protein